jgi:phosphatidylglycerol lysyltransferase
MTMRRIPWIGRLAQRVRYAPVTTLLAAAVLGQWLVTAAAGHRPDLSAYLVITVLLVLCSRTEPRLGSWLTAGIVAAGQVVGWVVAILGARTAWAWITALGHGGAMAPGPGLIAAVAAGTAGLGVLWRRRARVSLLAYLAMMVVYSGQLSDLQYLASALVGLALGRAVLGDHRRSVEASARPNRRETRTLVTELLLATGVGPVVASLHVRPAPPMTQASELLVTSAPAPAAVRTVCAQAGHDALCHVLRANLHSPRPDAVLLSSLPVLLTLVFADGLRRGRRAAWWGAIVTQVGFAAVILGDLLAAADRGRVVSAGLLLMTPPVALAILLLATRRVFAVPAVAGTYRRTLLVGGVLFVGALAVHTAMVMVLRDDFVPQGTLSGAVLDFLARLAPTPLVARPSLVPDTATAAGLAGAIAPLFWLLLLGVLLPTFWHRVRGQSEPDDRRAARRILRAHGGGTLSYQTMWSGHRYWFTDDGSAYVAYRVVAGVALTTAGPVGPPTARPAAVAGFASYCDRQAWIPCFYSVTDEQAEQYDRMGWQRLHVADEAVLDLTGLAFTGRRWQDIRTARNRAARANLEAVWCSLRHVDPSILDQVQQMSREWLATKGLPEMGFTLGRVDEALDDDVRCLIAMDGTGRVHAMTSWLPVHLGGAIVGWTLDLMRRRRDGQPGAVEFLIATAAEQFQREGVTLLSLSGTPFTIVTEGSSHAATRLMVGAGRILEPVYGFRSLLMFKAKFQPTYRPLYLTYPDAAALPAIGNAVGRAYLPTITLRQAARMVAVALR